jgi:hypothetical protein
VDEGQDFQTHWWVPMQYLLADPANGVFYVFRDDNQNIYQTATELPDGMETFRLKNMDAVLYVGCSRARNHLVVFADAALPKSTKWKLKHPDVPIPPPELKESSF